MVIASCDLVAVDKNLHELVKEKVEKVYPELKDKIITYAIHTHTSYEYTRKGTNFGSSLIVHKQMLPKGMEYKALSSIKKRLNPDVALQFTSIRRQD